MNAEISTTATEPWQRLRVSFRHLEHLEPGIGRLLDAYAMVDDAVQKTLQGRQPACGPGCHACCSQPIPVAPLEVRLLLIHAQWQQKTNAPRSGLTTAAPLPPCPFLGADGRCTVYALRPIACRQFLVFGRPCRVGEDVFGTRRRDVFTPDYAAMHSALLHTLPWYAAWPGFPGLDDPVAGVAFLQGLTIPLQSVFHGFRGA